VYAAAPWPLQIGACQRTSELRRCRGTRVPCGCKGWSPEKPAQGRLGGLLGLIAAVDGACDVAEWWNCDNPEVGGEVVSSSVGRDDTRPAEGLVADARGLR
jgi:hypothetical protein